MFEDPRWPARLSERLQEPLPGLEAQVQMAPEARQILLKAKNWIIPDDARQSAVLILLYPTPEGIFFPLIERTAYDGVHSRQISLPGGQTEPSDASHAETALRETEEEIGVSRHEVEVLGQLSPLYIPPSNFLVYPVLALGTGRPGFVPDPVEVASVIETPLLPLIEGDFRSKSKIQHRSGVEWEVPSYIIQGHVVWGATAMMLSELSVLLNGLRGR